MKNIDICEMYCGGKEISIDQDILSQEDLKILEEKDRILHFSFIGNNPKSPIIALVGLSPGNTQIKTLLDHYKDGKSFIESAEISGFQDHKKSIARMLRAKGIDKELNIEISDNFEFNRSPNFYTTSLVKCGFIKREGQSPSADFPPLDYECTTKCIKNRFLKDILKMRKRGLKKVIIFGDKGWVAVEQKILDDGKSVKMVLEENGLSVENYPHFSRMTRFLNYLIKFEQENSQKSLDHS